MKVRNLFKSFTHALSGFAFAFRNEPNFRIELFCGIMAIAAGVIFGVGEIKLLVIILMVVIVLVLELLNTAIEKMTDIVKPRLHEQVKIIKDIAAATVLCASIGSVFIGLGIFVPVFVEYFIK